MKAHHGPDGITVETAYYRLRLDERRVVGHVEGVDGRPWAQLRLLASVDCLDGPDETLDVTYRYDAGGVDHGRERFTAEDYAAIAASWRDYRSRHKLAEPLRR